jgi:hypothetical protein
LEATGIRTSGERNPQTYLANNGAQIYSLLEELGTRYLDDIAFGDSASNQMTLQISEPRPQTRVSRHVRNYLASIPADEIEKGPVRLKDRGFFLGRISTSSLPSWSSMLKVKYENDKYRHKRSPGRDVSKRRISRGFISSGAVLCCRC